MFMPAQSSSTEGLSPVIHLKRGRRKPLERALAAGGPEEAERLLRSWAANDAIRAEVSRRIVESGIPITQLLQA